MKLTTFKKILREEIRKVLKEEYRDPKDNIAIFYGMLKKGGRDGKYAMDLIKDIKSELNIVIDPKNAKATLALAEKNDELAEYFDSAIESALDDGMGRLRGMMGGMQGIRENAFIAAVPKGSDVEDYMEE